MKAIDISYMKRWIIYRICRAFYNLFKIIYIHLTDYFTGRQINIIRMSGASTSFKEIVIALKGICGRDRQDAASIASYEQNIKDYLKVKYASSFMGGRVALCVILKALDLKPGNEVIVPAFNCIVVINSLLFCDIKPIYADIDPCTFNILPGEITRLATSNTKAVIIQHIFGIVSDIEPLLEEAKAADLLVIEDCAHSLGAEYKGTKVGKFGKASFFSTEQSKVLSTQSGGFVVTDDDAIGEKVFQLQSQMNFPDDRETKQRLWQFVANYFISRPYANDFFNKLFCHVIGPLINFEPVISTTEEEVKSIIPENYLKRLPGALAKLGISQLHNIDEINSNRNRSAQQFISHLHINEAAIVIEKSLNTQSVFLRYPVYVKDKQLFSERMRQIGIEPGLWFTEVIHPKGCDYGKIGYHKYQCPNAEFAVDHLVNLPTGYTIDQKKLAKVFADIDDLIYKKSDLIPKPFSGKQV